MRVHRPPEVAQGDLADPLADLLGGELATIAAPPQKNGVDGLAGTDLARATIKNRPPDFDIAFEVFRQHYRQRQFDRASVLGLARLEYDPPIMASLDQGASQAQLGKVAGAQAAGTEDQDHEAVPISNSPKPGRELLSRLGPTDQRPAESEQRLGWRHPGSIVPCRADRGLETRDKSPEPGRPSAGSDDIDHPAEMQDPHMDGTRCGARPSEFGSSRCPRRRQKLR